VRSCFRLYEETSHVLLTPVYNVIFLEMGKFRKSLSELDGSILDGFYFCLKNMVKLSERPVELQQDIFQRLFEVCRLSKMDKVEQIQYNKAMITEIDIRCFKKMAHKSGYAAGEKKGEKAGFEKGVKKGIKEGIKEGREEGRMQGIKEGREEGQKIGQEIGLEIGQQNARVSIARQMKVKGYPVADISEMTGLPEDRIMAL
ncbi:MAG: PD-(D/E)XK nuclease family transposase, partial [Bacteroidales bacterium]|nr:PD-(D/E)XK nuclease family transposase [Bacteroidales bacterium]